MFPSLAVNEEWNMRTVEMYRLSEVLSLLELPVFITPVRAGFPSPADDYIDDRLDLNKYLIRNSSATFFLRVKGDSMIGVGMHDGDLIIVDASMAPEHGWIAVIEVAGEFTVKRLHYERDRLFLMPENPKYLPLEISPDDLNENYRVVGIVTNVIHKLQPRHVRPR